MPEPAARAGFRVFIDFDNTITLGDVLDGVIANAASPGTRTDTLPSVALR